jgi:glyoxylase-like metal-dependent hydrolase (beta-lactamase superfamily II)
MALHPERYETEKGARIYRIPLNLFPELDGFAHLVLLDDFCVLFDVGSGFGTSNDQLDEGIHTIRSQFGENVTWSDVSHVIISHGHIDHFGGLVYVREKCAAQTVVHSLDLRVLTHYEERLALVARRLEDYLHEAGLSPERVEGVMAMYMLNKGLFESQVVDLTCEELGMRLGRMEWIHVPGHCPGQIVALIDDILLSADHVLETTSPHQAPERLTLTTGLSHYLESLAKLRPVSKRANLSLGGHEGPVHDLDERICEIAQVHRERLQEILAITKDACTIDEIAQRLFPGVEGYHELLALEEAGAHIEYLHQRGLLAVENYEQVERSNGTPIQYKRVEGKELERLDIPFLAFDLAVEGIDHTAEVY